MTYSQYARLAYHQLNTFFIDPAIADTFSNGWYPIDACVASRNILRKYLQTGSLLHRNKHLVSNVIHQLNFCIRSELGGFDCKNKIHEIIKNKSSQIFLVGTKFHQVILLVSHQKDNLCTLRVYNTGQGCKWHANDLNKKKVLIFSNIEEKKLDKLFWQALSIIKQQTNIDCLYIFLFKYFKKHSWGESYSKQKAKNCTWKSLWVVIQHLLKNDVKLYRKIKKFGLKETLDHISSGNYNDVDLSPDSQCLPILIVALKDKIVQVTHKQFSVKQ